MPRPKTLNADFGEFAAEVMARFKRKQQEDPSWTPTENQVNVLLKLAQTQVTLQKGKPLDEDKPAKHMTQAQRDAALAAVEAAPPPDGAIAEPEQAE